MLSFLHYRYFLLTLEVNRPQAEAESLERTRLDMEMPDMMMPTMSVRVIIVTLKEHSSPPAGVKK